MQDHTYSSLSPIQIFIRNKWVRLILFFNIILLLVVIALLIWQSTKVSTISFNITPINSVITVNGDDNYQNGQYAITPGTYDITIYHEELEPKSFKIDIAPQNIVSISTFLSDADHTFDYYKLKENFSSYEKLKEIASHANNTTTDQDKSAEQFIQRFQEDINAMTTKLPIDYSETVYHDGFVEIKNSINIVADDDCVNTLCIQVHTPSTNDGESIKSLIQEKGFNVEDFQIEYIFY